MGDDITIGVTEIVNNIEVTAQPNDQIIDISVVDNTDEVTLNITPTVIEINVNKGSSYAKWGTILGTLSDQEDLQDALDLKADLVDGKVPSSQLPSYVDDVIEVANYAALPAVGESGKIYITLDDNHIFRWTGSTYVEITDNTAVWGAITGTLSSQTDLSAALNAKALKTTTISTNAPLSGGGDLSANRTLSISQASASVDGYLSSTDWNTFNSKLSSLSGAVLTTTDQSIDGIKTFTDYTKFTDSSATGGLWAVEIDVNSNDALVVKDGGTVKFQIGRNGEALGQKYKVSGGFSNQFLKANGDLDSTSYQPLLTNPITGTGTTNYVPKFTGTSALGNSLIYDNGTNVFVGGSGSNGNRFTVVEGGTTLVGQQILMQNASSANDALNIVHSGTGKLIKGTKGVEVFNITNSGGAYFAGNVGIGVTPSAWDSLWKVLQLSYGSLYSSIYSNIMAHNLYVAGEDTKYISSNLATQYEQNSGNHYWYTAPTGTAGANVTLTPRMILYNSGNLGIGTESSTAVSKFSVGVGNVTGRGQWASSAIAISNPTNIGAYSQISFGYTPSTTNASAYIGYLSTNQGANGYGDLVFGTRAVNTDTQPDERMRITSGGNVGIGTTSPSSLLHLKNNGSTAQTIESTGSANYASLGFLNTTTGYGYDIGFGGSSSIAPNSFYVYGGSSASIKFSINSSGAATFSSTVTATAFIPTSDIRLKDLTDYDYNVELIKPITFNWKGSEDKRKKIGYSAQQVQEVLPEVVNTDDKGMLSVDYNQIFVAKIDMLENMIQELKQEIEILKNK